MSKTGPEGGAPRPFVEGYGKGLINDLRGFIASINSGAAKRVDEPTDALSEIDLMNRENDLRMFADALDGLEPRDPTRHQFDT